MKYISNNKNTYCSVLIVLSSTSNEVIIYNCIDILERMISTAKIFSKDQLKSTESDSY